VRGGGSIEDLWAFNEEIVARAIRACPIPVVTASATRPTSPRDFVADRRAPRRRRSELVSPERAGLLEGISRLTGSLALRMRRNSRDACWSSITSRAGWFIPKRGCGPRSELLGQLRLRLGQAASRISSERRWEVVRLLQRAHGKAPNTDRLLATRCNRSRGYVLAMHATLERAGSACVRRIANLSHLDLWQCWSAATASSVTLRPDRVARASLAAGDLLDITFAEGGAHARVERSRRNQGRSRRLQSGSLGLRIPRGARAAARSSGERHEESLDSLWGTIICGLILTLILHNIVSYALGG